MSESETPSGIAKIGKIGRKVGEIVTGPAKKEIDPSKDSLLLDRAIHPEDPMNAILNPESQQLEIDLPAATAYSTASLPLFTEKRANSSRNPSTVGLHISKQVSDLLSTSTVNSPNNKQISCDIPLTVAKYDGTSNKTLGFQATPPRLVELQQSTMEALIAQKAQINPAEFKKAQDQFEQLSRGREVNKEKALHINPGDDIQVKEITENIANRQTTIAYLEIPEDEHATRIPVATKNANGQWVPTPEAFQMAQLDLSPLGKNTPAVQKAQGFFKASAHLTERQMQVNRDYHLDIRVADEPADSEWRNEFVSCDPHQAEHADIYTKGVVFRGEPSVKIAQATIHQWLEAHQSVIANPGDQDHPVVVRYRNLEAKGQFRGLDPEHPKIIKHTGLKRTAHLPEIYEPKVEENELTVAKSVESDPRETRVIEVFQTRPDGTKELTDAGYLLLWTTSDSDEQATLNLPVRGLTTKHKGEYEQHQWSRIRLTPEQLSQLRDTIWIYVRDHQTEFTELDVAGIQLKMKHQKYREQLKLQDDLNTSVEVAAEKIDQLAQQIKKLNNRSQNHQQLRTYSQKAVQSLKSGAEKASKWNKKDKDKNIEDLGKLWKTKRKEIWYTRIYASLVIRLTGGGAELARKASSFLAPSPTSPEDLSSRENSTQTEGNLTEETIDSNEEELKAIISTAGKALSAWAKERGQGGINQIKKGIATLAQGGQTGAETVATFLENDKKLSQDELDKNAHPIFRSLIPLLAIALAYGSEKLTGQAAVALQKKSDQINRKKQDQTTQYNQKISEIAEIIREREEILEELRENNQEVLSSAIAENQALLELPSRPSVNTTETTPQPSNQVPTPSSAETVGTPPDSVSQQIEKLSSMLRNYRNN